ncbi:MAG TPA: GyrI-like domain-containing protein, partial [Ktedonobacterales bacterium]|nr:GyrI-like domain-containing protein [Ktedonobacterales bacterium]
MGSRGAGTHMLKIGDFSRLSRISVVTLRHYADLGLLPPAWIDSDSGYRYYALDQLPQLHRILALKELGFSLEQVAQLLHTGEVPATQLRGMLLLKQAELEQQMRAQQARLAALDIRLRQIETGGTSAYDVVLRPVEAQLVATLRAVIPSGDAVERLFEEVETYVAQHRARAHKPPLAIYHDPEYRDREVDVEVAVPVGAPLSGTERIVVRELPGVAMMACVVHAGSYATIDQASGALFSWLAAQGYRIAGPYREVYLRFGTGGLQLALPG